VLVLWVITMPLVQAETPPLRRPKSGSRRLVRGGVFMRPGQCGLRLEATAHACQNDHGARGAVALSASARSLDDEGRADRPSFASTWSECRSLRGDAAFRARLALGTRLLNSRTSHSSIHPRVLTTR
jgi:hypothetical protein